ncbi:MAG: aspartate aminotransferase family protein [Actinomycetota bacterium]
MSESSRSAELFARASEVLPGGVGSSARSVRAGWTPYPPFIASGRGSRITDVDGNEYVDYLMGLGPLLFGHRPPEVTAAVVQAVQDLGTVFGLPYELEAEAARKVVDAVPSVDMVRFASSGSEAVGTAVRLARAITGRTLLLRFEGMYHGWMDTVYWSNHPDPAAAGPADRPVPVPAGKGLLPAVADSLVVLPWNDAEAITRTMAERGDQIAAIITEPVMLNTGCILPEPVYLQLLRDLATRYGALLIFDEVITGFRFARGGAQEFYGVLPDITTMAKGLGGGFPVAAIGGTRDVMEAIGDGRYSHSGTYNSNVIQMAAVSATMDLLSPERYVAARALGQELMDGIARLAAEAATPVRVVGLGTVFQVWFADEPIRNWRDAERLADEERFGRWWQQMRSHGVLFHPSQFENLFVSLAHTADDVARTLEAAEASLHVR